MAEQTCADCHFLVLRKVYADPVPRAQTMDPRSKHRRVLTTHEFDHILDRDWRNEIRDGKLITGFVQSLVDDTRTQNILELKYCCSMGVWCEDLFADNRKPAPEKCENEILEKERRDFCFYFPCRPGMGMEAARILQERNFRAKSSGGKIRGLKFWLGLAIALIGMDIFLRLASHFHWWPFG